MIEQPSGAALLEQPPMATEPRPGPVSTVTGLLRTARPKQWVKNVLVLAAPAAAGQLGGLDEAVALLGVLGAFTAASAAVYLVNDALDVEADRAHPEKRHRPIASGQVPVRLAHVCGAALAAGAVVAALLLCNLATAGLIAFYLLLQLAYCAQLKHLVVVDLVVVASGFLLRAMAGGIALGIPISRWFFITSGFAALFMVSAKRSSEHQLMQGGGRSRALLASYSAGYLRFVWQLAAGVTVLSYCLWALGPSLTGVDVPGTLPWRQLSIAPFLVAVLRYAVFADQGTAGAPEDVVLGDRPLLLAAVSWAVLYGLSVVAL